MAKLHFSLTSKDFPRNESYKVFPFNCPFLLHSPNLPYDFDLKHFGIIEESTILNPTSLLFDFNTKPKVIYLKYSKHWPYTVAHTIDCVCAVKCLIMD